MSITFHEREFFENTLRIAQPRSKPYPVKLQVFLMDDESELWALTLELTECQTEDLSRPSCTRVVSSCPHTPREVRNEICQDGNRH